MGQEKCDIKGARSSRSSVCVQSARVVPEDAALRIFKIKTRVIVFARFMFIIRCYRIFSALTACVYSRFFHSFRVFETNYTARRCLGGSPSRSPVCACAHTLTRSTHTHTRARANTHTRARTHARTYTHIHIHTHTCAPELCTNYIHAI